VEKKPESEKTSHILAVSHFEIVTHLIDDVFGIESTGKFNSPSFGEQVNVEAFKTDNPEIYIFKVSYDGKSKEVRFNRSTRSIEAE
jgi:hypothetical protein